ncbi:MAG: hypothetical protein ACOVKV_17335 [Novosphingobium sp.]
MHQTVLAEAFDPERFFDGRYVEAPILTIRYLGDDYDFPVYAIALYKGCHDVDAEGDRSCLDRLQARMIRAPYDGEPERPRWRGTRLLEDLRTRGVSSRKELLKALDDGAVEWLEADLATCPAALNNARSTDELRWFGEPLVQEPSDEMAIIMHFDTIDVRFRPNYFTDFRYQGHVGDGLPSGWADAFAKSLESCWKPATAIRPWRRAVAKTTGDK